MWLETSEILPFCGWQMRLLILKLRMWSKWECPETLLSTPTPHWCNCCRGNQKSKITKSVLWPIILWGSGGKEESVNWKCKTAASPSRRGVSPPISLTSHGQLNSFYRAGSTRPIQWIQLKSYTGYFGLQHSMFTENLEFSSLCHAGNHSNLPLYLMQGSGFKLQF